MSDQINETSSIDTDAAPSELDMLKARAKMMNIAFGPNIGVEALRKRIADVLAADDKENAAAASTDADETSPDPVQSSPAVTPDMVVATKPPEKPKVRTLREIQMEEQMALVRLRITNLDPKKAQLPGEIITFANEIIGTVSKYIPFGEKTDDGWHVPVCIYNILKDRKFLSIRMKKGQHGIEYPETRYVSEFALQELDPLTPEELAQLAATQAAAGLIG